MSGHGEPPLSTEFLLRLQKTVGNRVVQRVVAARTGVGLPAHPTVMPPQSSAETSLAPATVEVVTIVPTHKHRGWLFIIVRLLVRVLGWTGGRLRLKGKSADA